MKSRLRHKREQYESLSVVVIKAIRHSDALAVWVLLMAMPPNWHVNRNWLRDELNIGRRRLDAAIKKLTELCLWESIYVRCEGGKLCGKEVWIYDVFPGMGSRPPKVPLCDTSTNRRVTKSTTTHNEQNSIINKTKPAAGRIPSKEVSCELQFGVEWPDCLGSYIDEHRAIIIAMKFSLGSEGLRLVIAEFTAQSMNQLNLSKVGEENLPTWS